MNIATSIGRGVLGMAVLLAIAYLFSSNRKAIHWKTVGLGLLIQLFLAISILKGSEIGFNIGSWRFDLGFVSGIFDSAGKLFTNILEFTKEGSIFLLGGKLMDDQSFGFIFLFQVLPTIIFFSALTSVLFYLGIIQKIVGFMAKVMTKLLKISGAESLSVAGNIFLGQTEAPLMIKTYLEKMTKSEILLVMVGGMATVAGGVLAAYINFLGDTPEMKLEFARHLLAASVMAAPGAVVVSKMLFPETEQVDTNVTVSDEKIGSNILEAIATGTSDGLKLAANVAAMLLVFIAFIAMINGVLGWIGSFDGIDMFSWKITSLNDMIKSNTPYEALSLELILGYLFAPLMWLIGVETEDVTFMGQLLGIKIAASEFIGYIKLGELKDPTSAMHFVHKKSIIMATYMLCGFANFASIGIQIGGIGFLAPGQRKTLSELGMKALLGGTLASLLSATLIGMLFWI